MIPNTLMVVLTHPRDAAGDAEFNEWYTGNHVPDVLHSPSFREGIRFKRALTVSGDVPLYLALYHVDNDDIAAVDRELTEYLSTPDPVRIVEPVCTGTAADLVQMDVWAYFRKRLEVGCNDASPKNPPRGVLATMTGPANGAPVQELNAWYNAHVVDIVSTPGIRGGARYDRIEVKRGTIAPYFAFYDLETDDVEQVAADLAKTMAVCPSGGIPTNSDGDPWLQVDGFAYFTLVSVPTAEYTLLP